MANGKWAEVVYVGVQYKMSKPTEYTVLSKELNKPLNKDRYYKTYKNEEGFLIGIIVPEIFNNKDVYLNRIKDLISNGYKAERAGTEYSRMDIDAFYDSNEDYEYGGDYFDE